MEQSNGVAERIAAIDAELPPSVRLIAVSKYTSVDKMRQAYAAGLRDFGESRVLEAIDKQQQLVDLPGITWHLIGHLQTNKVRKAVQAFDWIHSVDSLRLLQQIDRAAAELNRRPRLCLQVKAWPDPNKQGWLIEQLQTAAPEILACKHVEIVGLMAIAPLGLNAEQSTELFQLVARWRQELSQSWGLALSELSMGMSDDYFLAVAAGATCVRVGSKVFNGTKIK